MGKPIWQQYVEQQVALAMAAVYEALDMGKDKKHFDENLQESRTKHHNKLRFQKRLQEEQEMNKLLREFQKAYQEWKNGDDEDR